jgi:hypothetical protein
LGAKGTPRNKKKPWYYQSFRKERLKGLEPSTFCMANGRAGGTDPTFCLQIARIVAVGAPQDENQMPAN